MTQKQTITIDPELVKKWHNNVVKEFSDVFCDKPPALKNRWRPKNTLFYRIQLKDTKKVINGRIFILSKKYLNWILDFLNYHMEMGHIYLSKSSVSAGTWMIPKKGQVNIMLQVVDDYRALNNNTIKNHIPIPRQNLILRRIAQAIVLGYINLPDAYYQINMHPKDIWKTAFKTSFGMFK